jgi:hypothetical protein
MNKIWYTYMYHSFQKSKLYSCGPSNNQITDFTIWYRNHNSLKKLQTFNTNIYFPFSRIKEPIKGVNYLPIIKLFVFSWKLLVLLWGGLRINETKGSLISFKLKILKLKVLLFWKDLFWKDSRKLESFLLFCKFSKTWTGGY